MNVFCSRCWQCASELVWIRWCVIVVDDWYAGIQLNESEIATPCENRLNPLSSAISKLFCLIYHSYWTATTFFPLPSALSGFRYYVISLWIAEGILGLENNTWADRFGCRIQQRAEVKPNRLSSVDNQPPSNIPFYANVHIPFKYLTRRLFITR